MRRDDSRSNTCARAQTAPARTLAAAALALLCACFTPGEPPPVRYYAPPAPVPVFDGEPAAAQVALRVRSVRAAGHLRDRLAWRGEGGEVGMREYERWSEVPATHLERALVAALAAHPELARTERATAPVLDVRLEAFEEDRRGSASARVVVLASLVVDGARVVVERTFEAAEPLARTPASPAELATALGRALDRAVAEVVDAAVEALTQAAPPPAAAPQ